MSHFDCDSASPDVNDSFNSEDYECKICYNYFDLERHTPILLSCSHTFCRECLDALHAQEGRGGRVGCPVCRKKIPVPENRVDNLPGNSALTVSLPLNNHEPEDSSNSDVQRGSAVSLPTSEEGNDSCHICNYCCHICKIFWCVGQFVCATSVCVVMVSFWSMCLVVMIYFFDPMSISHICLSVLIVLTLLVIIRLWVVYIRLVAKEYYEDV